jgi:hypothetical protein
VAGQLLVELGSVGPAIAASSHTPYDDRQLDICRNGFGHKYGLPCKSGVGGVGLAEFVGVLAKGRHLIPGFSQLRLTAGYGPLPLSYYMFSKCSRALYRKDVNDALTA